MDLAVCHGADGHSAGAGAFAGAAWHFLVPGVHAGNVVYTQAQIGWTSGAGLAV